MEIEEIVIREIEKEIRIGSCQFRKGSKLVTVTAKSDVNVTMLTEINLDNPQLDNYQFSGQARLRISNDNGFEESPFYIDGYAKVELENIRAIKVQIDDPISIRC
jgi:hypothetical protein